jgi:cob(I)alamin adenosyltransferase
MKINVIEQNGLYRSNKEKKAMSIYTGGGDKGNTSLLSGERISKDDARVEAYGTLDELGAHLGVCRALTLQQKGEDLAEVILGVQRDLFRAGMQLSSQKQYWPKLEQPIAESDIKKLERTVDQLDAVYGLPSFFVTPGETVIGGSLHVARTVCRRAERRILTAAAGEGGYELILKYINRLSDVLFSLSWALENRELIAKELNRS